MASLLPERYGKEDIQSEKIPEKAGRERFLGSDERIKFGNRGGNSERMSVDRKVICWNVLPQATAKEFCWLK